MRASPSLLTRQVIWQGLRYIAGGGLRLANSHLATPNHRLADDFIGICVASNVDPAIDEVVLQALRQLGVKRVRVDVSDDTARVHQTRLITRLHHEHFQVVLHLVQPLTDAKRMPNAEANQGWQQFVSSVLDQCAAQIVAVEIGNTINRKKWSGYSLPGFLQAWDTAYRMAKAHQLTVIGPNLQDFEPLYNVTVLNLLGQQQQLPDLHSNNLFVERVIQPELYDFRILKYRWARALRYNLIKKARLMQKIGAERGVPKLVSSVAFWAIYRIQRQLPAGAQKQADYLTRYFTLLAASGAVTQANWGAMICHREGLIDDGLSDATYPALERVAYYASADGEPNQYRQHPSFAAFKTVVHWLNGAQYVAAIASQAGLELHHLRQHDREVHIAWTINGQCAHLKHLYSAETLAQAQLFDRDGVPIVHAALVTESPMYLTWPLGTVIECLPVNSPLTGTVIDQHVAGRTYFPIEEGEWRGMLLAKDATEAAMLWQAWHPERLKAPSKQAALRHARNAIWPMPDPRQPERRVTVKQPITMHWHKQWLDRLKPSKAKRSWNGAMELMRRGVGTAMPVAFFEHRNDPTLRKNFYICEFVQHDFAISEAFVAFSQGAQQFKGVTHETLYRAFARFSAHMHGAGIYFRDFSGGNILVQRHETDIRFVLIDTARLHAYPKGVPRKLGLADLTRALNKLHWSGRKRVLQHYLAGSGTRLQASMLWPFYLYDFKVTLKRTIGRKGWRRAIRQIKQWCGLAGN